MKKIFYVEGMHCVSCEMLLETKIQQLKGVTVEKISFKKGTIAVDMKKTDISKKIEKIIEDNGYNITTEEKLKNKKKAATCEMPTSQKKGKQWRTQLILIVGIWGIVFLILKQLNVHQYLTGISDEANVGVALLMGLVASLSTCLAVTGSIVLGFAEYIADSKGKAGHVKTQLSFQIGRIVGFVLLGGVLGLIGQTLQMSLGTTIFLTILVGLVVLYMGLHMLGFLPSITKFGLSMPKSLGRNILSVKNPAFAPIIGALTFFLPCGFTQSMQLLAINGGSFWQGGLIMGAFAVGTAPVLFAVGMGGNYIKDNKSGIVSRIIGVLIVFFGIYSLNNALGLMSFGGGVDENQYMSPDTVAYVEDTEYERIEVGHNGRNMEPQVKTLKAGGSYEIIITPEANGKGCMSTMIIPKWNRERHRIIKGEPITYKVSNLQKGKYDVVCASMGMYQGSFMVE